MKSITVTKNGDEKKLSTYITSVFPKVNINNIYKALRKKDIRVNGKKISENITVHYNDKIDIYITDSILNGTLLSNIPIVYEDNNIVIFNKPYGLEVTGENSLESIMKKNYEYLKPCHRIDINTIGLVIFAKNEESLNILLDKIKKHEIEKHYIACVYGIPQNETYTTIEAFLFKDRKKSIVYISDIPKKGYVPIKTSYKLVKKNTSKNLSLLDVTLHTGKTHQIRAHLAHIGLPILGDSKYGSFDVNKKYSLNRQLLCSYSYKFNFETDSGILNYLNGKKINLDKVTFTEYL